MIKAQRVNKCLNFASKVETLTVLPYNLAVVALIKVRATARL